MKTIIELDERDLADIIAAQFDVLPGDVEIDAGTTTAGYGMQEYTVPYVRVRVTKDPPERP